MCVTPIRTEYPVARKDHLCDACEWFKYDIDNLYGELTFSEWRTIVKAKHNDWKVKKGQKYIKQANIQDGEIRTFKAIPEIHAICIKHDLYQC